MWNHNFQEVFSVQDAGPLRNECSFGHRTLGWAIFRKTNINQKTFHPKIPQELQAILAQCQREKARSEMVEMIARWKSRSKIEGFQIM